MSNSGDISTKNTMETANYFGTKFFALLSESDYF